MSADGSGRKAARKMGSVGFLTVGCKLNQFETEQMREAAQAAGHSIVRPGELADNYVINTCTVTSKSDYRSRQAARRALRLNPEATVIVTGCYAQRHARDVAAVEGVDVVLGNVEKGRMIDYLDTGKQSEAVVRAGDIDGVTVVENRGGLRRFGHYTRAFVKIQDGCDNRCAYCAVPLARGRSRSKPPRQVCSEVECLTGAGYHEIVLTGVHLGAYGRDLADGNSLVGLLEDLARREGLERLRLSSIEPTDLSDHLIDMLADPSSRLCPHVHIPLQSGDDGILNLMGRPYGRAFYSNLVTRIAERVPGCGIGADVMVGFPGENDKAFENTRSLLEALPVTYLHVFSYSKRPGTRASAMITQVPPETRKERSRILRELGKRKSLAFRRSLVGRDLDVLVLGAACGGRRTGLSSNYVKTYIDTPVEPNRRVRCRVTEVAETGVWASVCGAKGRTVG